MEEIILIKIGEIVLKGLNKRAFEDVLLKNLKNTVYHICFTKGRKCGY